MSDERITRPEIIEAIEKGRAEKNQIGEEIVEVLRDPVQSLPMRALVEALYGDDLYDSLSLNLQKYFFEVCLKVARAVVVAELGDAIQDIMEFGPEEFKAVFDPNFPIKPCGCGHRDNRHGLITAIDEMSVEKPGLLEELLSAYEIDRQEYYRVRAEVGTE